MIKNKKEKNVCKKLNDFLSRVFLLEMIWIAKIGTYYKTTTTTILTPQQMLLIEIEIEFFQEVIKQELKLKTFLFCCMRQFIMRYIHIYI